MSLQGPDAVTMTLAGEPASVPQARHELSVRLRGTTVPQDVQETAVLLLSEVVTNAVLHARTTVSVACTVDGEGLVVEVTDDSALLPVRRDHDADAVSGRGLELVEMLADSYGVLPGPAGKTVWFALGAGTPDRSGGWEPPPARATGIARLQGLPMRLFGVLQAHSEALLREYELLRLSDGADCAERALLAEASRVRTFLAGAVQEAAAAARDGGRHPDVMVRPPPEMAGGVRTLLAVLEAAEDAAVAGRLLARPALPELLELRRWFYGQVMDQLEGRPTVPWSPGALVDETARVPTIDVDLAWLDGTTDPVVVADDTNRILGASAAAAAMLGWTPSELVGRRVTVLVPVELREAHLAGFTRQLVTGRTVLIGRTVVVPALHRNGHEVGVRLTLHRRTEGSRTIYLGRIDPVERPGLSR